MFKILYNLETLSILLINSETFKQNFLKLNGLEILILFKVFIKKSLEFLNPKISNKCINLIYNLISTNPDQKTQLFDSQLFRTSILNVLISSKSPLVRYNLSCFFLNLNRLNEQIKYKLILLVFKNTCLPILINSIKFIRISARDLIKQSNEYFTLLLSLIENLSHKVLALDLDQDLNSEKMLLNQINWFRMFNLSPCSSLDQILLKGHFKLTIDLLFKSFLFQPFFSLSCDILQDTWI